jgi:phage/conjugal plasmid C-4 type zinc finger TraR family protein
MKELDLQDDWQYNNEEEAEMGQLHAIHNNLNAVAAVRRQLEKQATEPSAEECEECGDEIPLARRMAVPGCKLCVFCKERQERH